MACNFRTARLLELRAHELDPDDALITKRFLGYVPPDKQEPQLSQFIAAHPWFYPDVQKQRGTAEAVHHQLNGQRGFELQGERKETTLKLVALMRGPNHEYGVGLDLRLNNGRSLQLLLDTGASGILLNQKAVDKAGLEHLGSFESWGVGDAGKRGTFSAVADSCEVEGLVFKHCVVSALEGKHRVDPEDDGLIGADVFRDYLIEIDFQRHLMHLTPLPERPPNAQGYDRAPLESERGFTPVFRQGDHLYISTRLNQANWGLFLIDTGSQLSNVDSIFAAMSTKVRGNSNVRISGISGQVNKVFEADKATLQFGHFQQDNLGLVSFNLNNRPEHEEFRTSGILGIPVLSMFRLAIDYRNGLVNFDYVFAPKRKKKD